MKTTVAILIVLFGVLNAFPDGGSIPFKSGARIVEPNQRALIAFNGEEELLILSTDLQADRNTKVLEVFPFPSEPVVKKADADVFKKATDLINDKLTPKFIELSSGGGDFSTAFDSAQPAGRVTFHKKIGAHEIVVTQALRPEAFVEWVESYLVQQGVEAPHIPPALRNVIGEYIRDNFTWFVFDVVSLSRELVTKEAIQFRFACPFLYYPMRITRTEVGDTSVKLLIFSHTLFENWMCLGIAREKIRVVHKPVPFSGREVHGVSNELYLFLGMPDTMQVRNWRIDGRLDSFEDDVIVGDPRAFIKHLRSGE